MTVSDTTKTAGKERISWRCWRKTCRTRLQTNVFNITEENPQIVITHTPENHGHPQDNEMITGSTLANEMEQEVRNDPSKPIKRIYNETVCRADNDVNNTPEFHTVRSRLTRTRARLVPPIPHDIDDVIIENEWRNTWGGDQFLSHQDNDWGIVVYATRRNFRRLQRCRDIYIDGTFKTCPAPYSQFVTVHGNFHGRVIPLVMCLMTGKTVAQYRQLLQHIKAEVRSVTGHNFRPRRVILDFEIALITAVETELPRANVCGCYFHFCQSMWRKIQELGMARSYTRHCRLRRCLRKFIALGYLPLALVRHNFRLHANGNATARVIQRYPEVQDFIDYLENNYINGPNFPPRMWNVFERDTDTRTNNHVEGKIAQLTHKVITTFLLSCI